MPPAVVSFFPGIGTLWDGVLYYVTAVIDR